MTQDGRQIFLIGPMGSGKTTLGRRAARILGLEFLDCDEELERHCGASVSLIFDIEGESGFRERETRMLKELGTKDNVLIATGGGVITVEENRAFLKQAGLVVWLPASVPQQLRRLEQDKQRPLLQAPDRRARLKALAAARDPLYEQVAHVRFEPRQGSISRVAQQLADCLKAAQASNADL